MSDKAEKKKAVLAMFLHCVFGLTKIKLCDVGFSLNKIFCACDSSRLSLATVTEGFYELIHHVSVFVFAHCKLTAFVINNNNDTNNLLLSAVAYLSCYLCT